MNAEDSSTRLKKVLYSFSSLNDLGKVITSNGNAEKITKSGLYLILGTLSSSRGAILQYASGRSRMETLARKGSEEGGNVSFTLNHDDVQSLLRAPHAVDLTGSQNGLGPFLSRHRASLEDLNAACLSPLRVGDTLVGLLLVGKRFSGGEYSEEDLQILSMMSQQLSVALHNHKLFSRLETKMEENHLLYENLRQIYQETIQAFAVAIDAKDTYTQGHSVRVAQYAVAIGEELNLSEDRLEGIRLAGLLHDIGKVTVDSSIIRKEESLSPEEVREMHRHPSVGHDILASIKFPWGDLSKLARHHHEMVDGNGYPDGLKGDDITLEARIISLADSFDAMTSNRPYRKQIGLEATLNEIRRCMGTQFDDRVVCALFQVLKKELSQETVSHKILPSLNLNIEHERILSLLEVITPARRTGKMKAAGQAEKSPGSSD